MMNELPSELAGAMRSCAQETRATFGWKSGRLLTGVVSLAVGAGCSERGFSDVTATAGVRAVQWDGVDPKLGTAIRNLLPMVGGAAAGDFDGDGWCDLFVTRVRANSLLYRNLRDGTFDEVGAKRGIGLSEYATGCAWGDVDNDGDLDLFVLTMSPSLRHHLFINDAGHFSDQAVERGVAMSGPPGGNNRLYTSAAFGDVDLDGWLDLFVTAWGTGNDSDNRFFRNARDGFFVDATDSAFEDLELAEVRGFTPRFADVTDDGWPDLLIAADFETSKLYRNDGGVAFTDITESANVGTDENGMGASTGDVDNDGDLDWFVTSIFSLTDDCPSPQSGCFWGISGNRLYRNEGASVFDDATDIFGVRDGGWGWGTSFLDFDNDGDLDLAMTNGIVFSGTNPAEDPFHTDPNRLWRNDGAGVMTEVSESLGFADTQSGKGLVVFDYDRDGDLDIFVANNADHPVLYRNDSWTGNDWLRIRLVGRQTNSFGIGARIHIQAIEGGPVQMREVSASSNYMSQNEVIAHFGLGIKVPVLHQVRVDWPVSQRQTVLTGITPNQLLVIVEPEPEVGE